MSVTQVHTTKADGVEIFYRESGDNNSPVVLLLHGFPSSSFQYRNLITKLAGDYRVIAPDLPGFGFTVVPETRKYEYTFDNFAKTIEAFVDALGLKKYAIYIFDYGAPVGLRLARSRPSAITAIVSQNGNAFNEGFGDAWKGIFTYWKEPTATNRQNIAFLTTFNLTKSQLFSSLIWTSSVDQTNVAAYPSFHEYFREYQPPLIAIWGKNDIFFIPPGAEAFKTLLPKAEVHFVDGGHFALENHLDEISSKIIAFFKRNGI